MMVLEASEVGFKPGVWPLNHNLDGVKIIRHESLWTGIEAQRAGIDHAIVPGQFYGYRYLTEDGVTEIRILND